MKSDQFNKGVDRLYRQILWNASVRREDRQQELSDERMLQEIQGRRTFTSREYANLLSSAPTQDRYALLKQQQQARFHTHLLDSGIDPEDLELHLLAADDEDEPLKVIHIDNSKLIYSVDFTPLDTSGNNWRIDLHVPKDIAKAAVTGLRLVDSEGRVWVEGFPDESGEMIGFWQKEERLQERMQRVKLKLEPR